MHAKTLIGRTLGSAAVLLAVAGFSAAPAFASAPNASSCTAPTPTQALMGNGDFNYYVPAPDPSPWTLTGGAQTVTTQLADGTTGEALDLPAGSQAVSPYICVNSSYTSLRMMVESLQGGGNVNVAVGYAGQNNWTNPQNIGGANAQGTSWTLSNPSNLNVPNLPPAPGSAPGANNSSTWQIMQITLTPGGGHNEYYVDNLNLGTAAPAVDTSGCSATTAGEPFMGSGDFNYYVPAPTPNGWSLSGGAQVETTTLSDGTTGQVLDLPAGSQAVSPDICVNSSYTTLRMMVDSLQGGGNVNVAVAYAGQNNWTNPQNIGGANGQGTSWTLSNPTNLNVPNPPPAPGSPPGANNSSTWQIMRLVLTPGGGHNEYQVYDANLGTAAPAVSTSGCTPASLSQLFLPLGDTNYYTPAPGQSGESFTGAGWTLSGGASIVNTTLGDGSTGQALDLPTGAQAVSPAICVTQDYPMARMMIDSLYGNGQVSFRVSYGNTNSWTNPNETGHVQGNGTGWTLSSPIQLQPGNVSGWQMLRITLIGQGGGSEFQIYNLNLDPYSK